MAKQTFTTGQVLTAAQMTSLQQTAMGGGSATAKTASYVLVAADAGGTVAMNAAGATTITVNTALFAAGDTVFIQNLGAGNCVVTAGTATVSTAGSLTLPQYDAGILYFTATGAAIFYDYVQGGGSASPLTTKGDVYGFSTVDARIPIGANDTVLTADSTQSLGLKWAAPAGGGGMTLLSTTSLSGATTTISVASGYNSIFGIVSGVTANTGDGYVYMAINNVTNLAQTAAVSRYPSSTGSYGVSNSYINFSDGYSTKRTDSNNAWAFEINNYASSSTFKPLKHYGTWLNDSSTQSSNNSAGGFFSNTAVTSLVFSYSGGNLSTGTVLLYGVK